MPIARAAVARFAPEASRSPSSSSSRTRRWRTTTRTGSAVAASRRSRSASAGPVSRSPTASTNAQIEPGSASGTRARTSSTEIGSVSRYSASLSSSIDALRVWNWRVGVVLLDEAADPLRDLLRRTRRQLQAALAGLALDPAGQPAALGRLEVPDRCRRPPDRVGQALLRWLLRARLRHVDDDERVARREQADRREHRVAAHVGLSSAPRRWTRPRASRHRT